MGIKSDFFAQGFEHAVTGQPMSATEYAKRRADRNKKTKEIFAIRDNIVEFMRTQKLTIAEIPTVLELVKDAILSATRFN